MAADNNYVTIDLPGGTVFIDECDVEFVAEYGIRIKVDDDYKAVYLRKGQYEGKILARVLVSVPSGYEVDHRNGNSLDNRRDNLRVATRLQNAANLPARKDKKDPTLPKGVYRRGLSFRAKITWCNLIFQLGTFETVEQAKAAYDAKAKLLFGEFRRD